MLRSRSHQKYSHRLYYYQIINHQKCYFDPTGKQAKGKRLLLDNK
ncbi:hypothetical protein LK438_07475 [Streptococcus thermophilus LMD-9]|nr:hypothetical protein LK438_07475 [Streptococcus thermophilus LMD-9]